MPKTQSINQNLAPYVLPNFRNMGVALRSLLLVNGIALLAAIFSASSWREIAQYMVNFSALLQPILLLNLLALYILNPMLARLPYVRGVGVILLLAAIITLMVNHLGGQFYIFTSGEYGYFHLWRNATVSIAITTLLLIYFRSRAQALSPALHEARLQALQARIRPHFLFNTINAVLGIVRADPKRAETALEDMADLFRMAMAHHSDLVPAHKEILLARQYLALEQMRLGERLNVNWDIQDLPDDVLIPPLILQPLLENAVYHGIEPLTAGGEINIKLYRNTNEIHLDVHNPRQAQSDRHSGNKMALNNIRERLALQFDVEGQYRVEAGKNFYHVHIMLPYIKEEKNEHS